MCKATEAKATSKDGKRAAPFRIQNGCTLLFVCNDLACLPGANCTTGAQRFLTALSNRLPLPLADARHAAVQIGRGEVEFLHPYDRTMQNTFTNFG